MFQTLVNVHNAESRKIEDSSSNDTSTREAIDDLSGCSNDVKDSSDTDALQEVFWGVYHFDTEC